MASIPSAKPAGEGGSLLKCFRIDFWRLLSVAFLEKKFFNLANSNDHVD